MHQSGFAFKPPAGDADEHILQGGFTERDRADHAGEGFDERGNEFVTSIALDAQRVAEDDGVDGEFLADGGAEGGGIVGGEGDDVAADLVLQCGGCVARDQLAVIHDRQAIAMLGFVQQVGGHQNGDAVFLADFAEVLPEIDAGAGVEAGAGFVEQQKARAMEKTLGEFDPAAHPAAESGDVFTRALGQTHAGEHFVDTAFEVFA